jgi:hypothetical protein
MSELPNSVTGLVITLIAALAATRALTIASTIAPTVASTVASTVGLVIRVPIRALGTEFMITRLAPAAATILLLLRGLVSLARPSVFGVERLVLIDWDILTNHLLNTS